MCLYTVKDAGFNKQCGELAIGVGKIFWYLPSLNQNTTAKFDW